MASGNPALRHLAIDCIADGNAVGRLVAAARLFGALLTPETATRLAIITEELVSNLIDHAEMPRGAAINLVLALEAGRVRFILTDQAAPFDPRTPQVEHIRNTIPTRGAGAGLALVRAWTVIDSYERVGACNVLTLTLPDCEIASDNGAL